MSIALNETHEINRVVLKSLRGANKRKSQSAPIMAPESHANPYWEAGSHPDIVERLWDRLGASLAVDCKAIVYGRPALVHPDKGLILALAYGTSYALRIPMENMAEAIKLGCTTERVWSGGKKTDVEVEFGQGWVFGCFESEEKRWLATCYEQFSAIA